MSNKARFGLAIYLGAIKYYTSSVFLKANLPGYETKTNLRA